MYASLAPLRLFLGALCVFFSYWLGRAISARMDGTGGNGPIVRWSLRAVVTALGAAWGGLDWISITSFGLAIVSLGAGVLSGQRPKKRPAEDLTKLMFPDR